GRARRGAGQPPPRGHATLTGRPSPRSRRTRGSRGTARVCRPPRPRPIRAPLSLHHGTDEPDRVHDPAPAHRPSRPPRRPPTALPTPFSRPPTGPGGVVVVVGPPPPLPGGPPRIGGMRPGGVV